MKLVSDLSSLSWQQPLMEEQILPHLILWALVLMVCHRHGHMYYCTKLFRKRFVNFSPLLSHVVINVFMDPRDITITEPSLIVFSFITITVSGPGFFTPSVNVNLRPLTYGQYAALGGNVDQEFPSRPQQAAEGKCSQNLLLLQYMPLHHFIRSLSDPVPAWSCCLNYLCACTAQNDFNITVRPIRATGPYLVSLDNLVFSDRIDEPDEGFILYLEVDTERTTLDSSSVIVINNNATLVIIQNGKCMHFLYMLGMV